MKGVERLQPARMRAETSGEAAGRRSASLAYSQQQLCRISMELRLGQKVRLLPRGSCTSGCFFPHFESAGFQKLLHVGPFCWHFAVVTVSSLLPLAEIDLQHFRSIHDFFFQLRLRNFMI